MITLRLAEKEDLEFMRMLRNENKQYFFREGHITKEMHWQWWLSFTGIFMIILSNNTRVGTISLSPKGSRLALSSPPEYWEVGNVIIAEKHRKKGILAKTLKLIRKEYDGPFVLQVRGDNEDAIAAYTKLGFKIRSLTMQL